MLKVFSTLFTPNEMADGIAKPSYDNNAEPTLEQGCGSKNSQRGLTGYPPVLVNLPNC